MRNVIYLFSLILFFGCSKDENKSNEINENQINEENTIVDIQVEIPEEAAYSINSLEIFSLFESKQISNDGMVDLEIFNGENLEFNVVNNASDSPVLFGFIDPSIQSTQKIDAMSTAKALIMIGPWALGLTKSEKLEALATIPTISGFDSFLTEVEQAIINQNLSNIDPVEMQAFLIEEVADRNGNGQIFTEFYPHNVYVDTQVSVLPEVDFDASYSLSLYSENTLIDEKLLLGQLDSQLVIDFILTGTTSSESQDEVNFDFAMDGNYELRARNGLSLDDDHSEAFIQNFSVSIYEALGVFTGSFRSVIGNNADCVLQILNIMKADPEFQVALTLYKNQEIGNYEMAKRIFLIFKSTISSSIDILNDCNVLQNNSGTVIRILTVIAEIYERATAVINTTSILYDWNTMPSEYNACIKKIDGNNSFCQPFMIIVQNGPSFGNVPIGEELNKTVRITNTTESTLIIDSIDFEYITNSVNQFSSNFNSATLEPQQFTEFTVYFNGDGDIEANFISAKMIVENNLNEINNFEALTAFVVNAINVSPDTLDFGPVTLNEQSSPQTITIQNTSDYPTDVSVQTVPNGYSISPILFLTEIQANSSIDVNVTFQPTSTTENYTSELEIISNDSSQDNIIISLSGSTSEENELINQIKLLNNNQILDFNNLPQYDESLFDNICSINNLFFGFNQNWIDGQNWLEIGITSNTANLQDGTYNLADGECSFVDVIFGHSDIFNSEEQGYIQNGTITVSENATIFEISGELIKIDANDNDVPLGQIIGRLVFN